MALSKAVASARAQQMVVVQNIQGRTPDQLHWADVEQDGYADDIDREEVEGGDGEAAQARQRGRVTVPDPYALPVAPTPSAFPIASSMVRESWQSTPTCDGDHEDLSVCAGAASTFPRVDGHDGGPMIARGEDEVSPVLAQWPFITDSLPTGGART